MKWYLVGGSIRDFVISGNRGGTDVDVVVVGSSTKEMLDLGFESIGEFFPVFRHKDYPNHEFALARKEKKIGEGHTGFECVVENITLEEDLSRRDFTMNAMAIPYELRDSFELKDIIDPFNGIESIKKRELNLISVEAFSEDPLRVFRALRFVVRFGYNLSESLSLAITFMSSCGQLNEISNQRIIAEIKKILLDGFESNYFPIKDNIFGVFDNIDQFYNFILLCDKYKLFTNQNFLAQFDNNLISIALKNILNLGMTGVQDVFYQIKTICGFEFKLDLQNFFTIIFGLSCKKYISEISSDVWYVKQRFKKLNKSEALFCSHSNTEKFILTLLCFSLTDENQMKLGINGFIQCLKTYMVVEKAERAFVDAALTANPNLSGAGFAKMFGVIKSEFRKNLANELSCLK